MTEESLFELALQTPPDERAALLDRECGPDAGLRVRIEALLAADREAEGWLTSPHLDTELQGGIPQDCSTGTLLGERYQLLQLLGEGGMGSVWLAEQLEPVKRQVAVKLIRAERGNSNAILTRFEAERQASALMDHPNIAKLLDAGTTETGQPFFVMELVKGVPLNQFCDEQRLGIPERLKVFAQICAAVQHAHQKGIIHRDLKPGNILVESHDGKAMPRVIDFGLAKAIGGVQLTEQSLFTAFGSVVGTPLYMAPEQARFDAVDVDTRADIYALGVILYELLTGTTPLTRNTLKQAAVDEVFRLIREQEPPPPSSRISTPEVEGSANRQPAPGKLGRLIKGELDWIALKALAKERDHRYQTARDFAQDIERYLNHEPVSAGPPSASYRFRKFVRRHRPQVIAVGLVLLALLGGIVGTTIGFFRAEWARQDAVSAAQKERIAREAEETARLKETEERLYAEAIAAFVRDDFLALTSTEGQYRFASLGNAELNPNLTLKQMLDRAADNLDARRDLAPRIEADLRGIIGVNYRARGEYVKSIRHLRRCLDLRRQTLGADHFDTLQAQTSLGVAYMNTGELDKALALIEQALELHKSTVGPDHATTLATAMNQAQVYLAARNFDKALPLFEELFKRRQAIFGPDHPDTLLSMHELASALVAGRKLVKAVPLFEDTFRRTKAKFGPDHPFTLRSMNGLALAYHYAGGLDKALPLYEQALELRKAKLDPDHPEILGSMNNLAGVYHSLGKLDRSIPLFEDVVARSAKKVGRDHSNTQLMVFNLAVNYLGANKVEMALPLLEETHRSSEKFPNLQEASLLLAQAYVRVEKRAEATKLAAQQVAQHRQTLPSDSPQLADALAQFGDVMLRAHAFADAEPVLRDALSIKLKAQPEDWSTFNTRSMLGGTLLGQKKHKDAEPLLIEGYEGLIKRAKTLPQDRNYLGDALDRLIELYTITNKPDEAKKYLAERAKYPRDMPAAP